jgi:DNA-binding response OmpR family regulator
VEDDQTLSFITGDNLERKGYLVDFCENGIQALEMLKKSRFDICILDVMLPKMDGFTLATKIRERNAEIPILFLTARSTMEDRIHGLQLGADDYLTKPFSMEELILKIEIFLRRSRLVPANGKKQDRKTLGDFVFDIANQQLTGFNKNVQLTFRESELLRVFTENINLILKREDILLKVWGNDKFFSSRSLDVFVSRLRKMLKADPSIQIENIHNIGYRMKMLVNEQNAE